MIRTFIVRWSSGTRKCVVNAKDEEDAIEQAKRFSGPWRNDHTVEEVKFNKIGNEAK